MSSLTAVQRKILYLVVILALFPVVIYLGMPAVPSSKQGATASGGLLAQQRAAHKLGETSLGAVDPTSATMNLVLLGMRGLAVSKLWHDALEEQKHKDWGKLKATTNSIILLQPHYPKVWQFQAWNLGFNVSVEWDAVEDRYYWVKEGTKFLQRGVVRNAEHPELLWHTGNFIANKIGRADESKQFRAFFRGKPPYFDPEPDPEDTNPDLRLRKKKYPLGYDTDINPTGDDNYLVGKIWFDRANEAEVKSPHLQHIEANVLFRSNPARALIDYATALNKDGEFGEKAQDAWKKAKEEWIEVYGRHEFDVEYGHRIRLEYSQEEIAELLREDRKLSNDNAKKTRWIDSYWKMSNYQFWRTRLLLESTDDRDSFDPGTPAAGDVYTITLNGKSSIQYTAKSGDVADVVRGLEDAWNKSSDELFLKGKPEDRHSRLEVKWIGGTVPSVTTKVTNGEQEKADQLVYRIETRQMVEAHRMLYEGAVAFQEGNYSKAADLITQGLTRYDQTLQRFPQLMSDDTTIDEILLGLLYWRQSLELDDQQIPEDYPMKWMYVKENGRMQSIDEEFRRRNRAAAAAASRAKQN